MYPPTRQKALNEFKQIPRQVQPTVGSLLM